MAGKKLTANRTHGKLATYGVGCRCKACTAVWSPYYVARQRQWRIDNPEKFRAQLDRRNAARRKRRAEERLRAGDGN